MLIHHANTAAMRIFGTANSSRVAIYLNLARRGRIEAHNALHQRTFPCAILTQKGMNSPWHQRHRNLV